MNKFSLYKVFFSFIIFQIVFGGFVFSQCTVDAGNNITICIDSYGMKDTIYLGGNPTAQGGIPPYIYTWSCEYWVGSTLYTASHVLDDTTIANPKFILAPGTNYLTFYLVVTDSIGSICFDSINIRFSRFEYSLAGYDFYIEKGDSAQFYGIPFIWGGINPLSYTWHPTIGLNNANDLSAWASPDTTTYYSLSAVDSAGCESDTFIFYNVFVYPTGIENFNYSYRFNVFPNPASEFVTINFVFHNRRSYGELKISNSLSKVIQQYNISECEAKINTENLPDGIYLVAFYEEGILQYETKLVIQH